MTDTSTSAPGTETPTAGAADSSSTPDAPVNEAQDTANAPSEGDAPSDGSEAPAEDGAGQAQDYSALTTPEGAGLPDDYLDSVVEFATQADLTPDAAQAVIDREIGLRQEWEGQLEQDWEGVKSAWEKDLRDDPEIGGEGLNKTLERVFSVLEKHGPEGYGLRLKEAGYLKEPGLVRTLAAIHAAYMEEPSDVARGGPQGDGGELSAAEEYAKLFPASPVISS